MEKGHLPTKIKILLPTSDRPEVIGFALNSLAQQTHPPDEIIVFDNGSIPIFSNFVNRAIWDILGEKNIKTEYIRINKRVGIVFARRVLLEKVYDEHFMFLDDDIILEPNYIETLLLYFPRNVNFICGSCLLANNEIQKPDYSVELVHDPEVFCSLTNEIGDHQWAYFRYTGLYRRAINYGNLPGTLFRKKTSVVKLIKALEGLPDNSPLEDFILTYAAKPGCFVSGAVSWHLFDPAQKRDWRYALENTLRTNFEVNPEEVISLLKRKRT